MTDSDPGADDNKSGMFTVDRLKELAGLKPAKVKNPEEPYEIRLDGYPVVIYHPETGEMVVDPTNHEKAEIVNAVPITELEQLAYDWEQGASTAPANDSRDHALRDCAQELREVIESYE